MGFTVNEWILAAGAGIAAMWHTLRAWLELLVSIVWVRAEVMNPASAILLRYLEQHYHRGSLGTPVYNSWREYVRPRRRVEQIAVELTPVRRLYRSGLALLVVSARTDNQEARSPGLSMSVGHIRGFLSVEQLLIEAHREYAEQQSGAGSDRFGVRRHFGYKSARGRGGDTMAQPVSSPPYESGGPTSMVRPLGWKMSDLGADTSALPFKGLVYPPHVEAARTTIHRWRSHEGFYRERRIPWRLGVLLSGGPGTGKTSFARAIAQELGFPIHVVDLPGMDNEDLRSAWLSVTADTPCIVLFEDLDRVFNGSENVVRGSHLTLDALLNCISGVEPAEGVLTIVTANDAGRLDRALGVPESNGTSSRPGRLDMAVEFGAMDEVGKARLAHLITGLVPRHNQGPTHDDPLAERAHYEEAVWQIVNDDRITTPAQVQARCAELALARLYDGGMER